ALGAFRLDFGVLVGRKNAFCGVQELIHAFLGAAILFALCASGLHFGFLVGSEIEIGVELGAIHFAAHGAIVTAGEKRTGGENERGNRGEDEFHVAVIARLRVNSTSQV